jgi:hypothetical protein
MIGKYAGIVSTSGMKPCKFEGECGLLMPAEGASEIISKKIG